MLLNKKHKKIVNVIWAILSVLIIISMVGFFSLPFLFQ